MNTPPTKLSKEVMEKLPPAAGGQYVVRDTEEPGFFVVVGARTKTFTVQVDVVTPLGKRQTKKRAVGRWPEVSVAEARRAAREAKVEIAREGGGREGGALTFGAAWAELRAAMEQDVAAGRRSAATVRGYDYSYRLLADWERTPLARLSDHTPEVRKRHRELTASSGPSSANAAMVFLRRVYNYARKRRLDPKLPAFNPVDSIDFNPQRRRDTAMSASELPGWFKKLGALPNPVRREFHLFCLLSGSRPGALTVARWEHLDVTRRVLHVPLPKGASGAPSTSPCRARCWPASPARAGRADRSTRSTRRSGSSRGRGRGRTGAASPVTSSRIRRTARRCRSSGATCGRPTRRCRPRRGCRRRT